MTTKISDTIDLELPQPYEILESIGEGTFAKVFKAKDVIADKIVAAKVLLPAKRQPNLMARFNQEWEIIQKLNAVQNVIKVFSKGMCSWGSTETVFFTMELIEGGSLGKKLKEEKTSFHREQAMKIIKDLSTALEKAHNFIDDKNTQGIVHRDVKPDNILLEFDANGEIARAILTDFGIAKVVGNNELQLTRSPQGSLPYMAPEQLTDFNNITNAIDTYALAVTFFEMLVGTDNFDKMRGIEKDCLKPVPPLSKTMVNCPSYQFFDGVLIKATADKKEDRYQDINAFYKALDEANKKAKQYEERQELASKIIGLVQELKYNAICEEPKEYEIVLTLLDMAIKYLPNYDKALVLKSELYMQGYNNASDETKKECIAFLRRIVNDPSIKSDSKLTLKIIGFIAEKSKDSHNVK